MGQVGAAELAMFQKDMTDQQKMMFMTQYYTDKKDRTIALVLSLLLGYLGVDRFYMGDTGLGVLKLLTFGMCGIMAIVDWFLIMGRADEYNRTKAQEIATVIKASMQITEQERGLLRFTRRGRRVNRGARSTLTLITQGSHHVST